MDANWTHPRLGVFTYDEDVNTWAGEVEAPAFDAFTYDPGYTAAGTYELTFEAEDDRDAPSAAAVTLAERVIANADDLVPAITTALWDDFNGRGPDSGMWWNGDLSTVADMTGSELLPPASADDLLALMQLFRISVRKGVNRYERPVVELCFWAAYEQEHSVGVLTDGKRVLGTGYHLDVEPFKD